MRRQLVGMALAAAAAFVGAVVALAAASQVSTEPSPAFVSPYRKGTSAEPPAPVVQTEAVSSIDSTTGTSGTIPSSSPTTTRVTTPSPSGSSGSGRSSPGETGSSTSTTSPSTSTSEPDDHTTSTTIDDHDDSSGPGSGSSGSGSGRSGSGQD